MLQNIHFKFSVNKHDHVPVCKCPLRHLHIPSPLEHLAYKNTKMEEYHRADLNLPVFLATIMQNQTRGRTISQRKSTARYITNYHRSVP